MEIKTYRFSWNGRHKFIDAFTLTGAMQEFQERFGFWPDTDHMEITVI